jgi:hypothetical protein
MRESMRAVLRVNLGPYESAEVSAWSEVDYNNERDMEILKAEEVDVNDPKDVGSYLQWRLDNLLESGIRRAERMCAEEDSFSHQYVEDVYFKKEKR